MGTKKVSSYQAQSIVGQGAVEHMCDRVNILWNYCSFKADYCIISGPVVIFFVFNASQIVHEKRKVRTVF
jgi:hypothetical protein